MATQPPYHMYLEGLLIVSLYWILSNDDKQNYLRSINEVHAIFGIIVTYTQNSN